MKNKIYRYIDFDGVLFNTNEIIDNLILEKQLTKEEDIRAYISKLNFYKIISSAKPINNSLYYLKKLLESDKYITKILSHTNSKEESLAKTSIIKDYINNIDILCVPKYIPKSTYVDPTNAILVDDYKPNLLLWQNNQGLPIHFDKELNKSTYPVISTLENLDTKIEQYYPKVLTLSNRHQ